MFKRNAFFAAAILAATLTSVARAEKTETAPFVGPFRAERTTLDNGLKLLVVEDHSSPTFAYQTWFRVGSRDEVPGLTGLAHLFEHMMFKGTKNHAEGEFDRLLEGAGVEGENAFTDRDYTAYIQELPADKLDLIAGLEADRMVNLEVNDQSFKTEREVVQNERRFRNENNPEGAMWQSLFDLAYRKHSYHWPVIGYSKDLEAMKAGDAMAFYHAHYSPNHATIVVVGDVDASEVLKTVKARYGALKAANPPEHSIPAEPPQTSARKLELKLNIQVPKLLIGYHVPGMAAPDIPAVQLLESVLGGGKSSRLWKALVNTGIASSVEAGDTQNKDPSLLTISATLQAGHRPGQAEAVILREIAQVAAKPVPAAELERARNRLNFAFYDGLGSAFEKAYFLGIYETSCSGFQVGLDQQQRLQTLTGAEVSHAAARYLKPANRTTIEAVPVGGGK